MGEAAALSVRLQGPAEDVDALSRIRDRNTEEFVIGLCGPIGTAIPMVAERLKKQIETIFGYDCNIIKLSSFIEEHIGGAKTGYVQRTLKLIEGGNSLRGLYGQAHLANLAIHKIRKEREEQKLIKGDKKHAPRRVCHIIDSIKNSGEYEVLKAVYQDLFYFVGVYSPVEVRETNLRAKQVKEEEIQLLINRDSGEEKEEGQQVSSIFPKVDLFMRIEKNSHQEIDEKVLRFFNLVFRTKIITPTPEETAMYLAMSAAGSSACLSRQVGACLTDSKGEVISVGWNDVPKFGGDLYSGVTTPDHRCIHIRGGICSNDVEKDVLTEQVVQVLIEKNIIPEEKRDSARKEIRSSKIKDIIEFSRSIHAEMHAIILGSQKAGARVRGGRLFVTTYPCHSCARHIIVSGITQVYYLEPYRKSLALKLHEDAFSEDLAPVEKVTVRQFDGISPNRYLDFFRISGHDRKEKSGGKMREFDEKNAVPLLQPSLESFPAREAIVIDALTKAGFFQDDDFQLSS